MLAHSSSARLQAGGVVADRTLLTAGGAAVHLLDGDRLVHLQFRRFAGCPVCNLHLRSFVQRYDEVEQAGIREVAVFHSPADELLPHTVSFPFDAIADPKKRLYVEFGVESGARALLDPRAWLPIVRGIGLSLWEIVRHGRPLPSTNPSGGRLGLPADFLIAPDGHIIASTYGEHAYDQWSVDELLALARAGCAPALTLQPGA